MYFSEPLTDFRAHLYTDDGQSVELDFNVYASVWHVNVDHGVSRATLREMVTYLHDQFYRGEQEFRDDWLQIVDRVNLERPNMLILKTVDRLVGRAEQASRQELEGVPQQPQGVSSLERAGDAAAASERRNTVDADDPDELRYWAQRFQTTEDDVRDAVAQVGPDAAAVGDFLQSGRHPHRHPSTHRPPRLRDENLRRGGQ